MSGALLGVRDFVSRCSFTGPMQTCTKLTEASIKDASFENQSGGSEGLRCNGRLNCFIDLLEPPYQKAWGDDLCMPLTSEAQHPPSSTPSFLSKYFFVQV